MRSVQAKIPCRECGVGYPRNEMRKRRTDGALICVRCNKMERK